MYTGKDPGSRAREAAPAGASSEGIIIDPGVLHEEKKASSALTDIYGVPLFTDGYEQSVLPCPGGGRPRAGSGIRQHLQDGAGGRRL